jgi:hypothetical protein
VAQEFATPAGPGLSNVRGELQLHLRRVESDYCELQPANWDMTLGANAPHSRILRAAASREPNIGKRNARRPRWSSGVSPFFPRWVNHRGLPPLRS